MGGSTRLLVGCFGVVLICSYILRICCQQAFGSVVFWIRTTAHKQIFRKSRKKVAAVAVRASVLRLVSPSTRHGGVFHVIPHNTNYYRNDSHNILINKIRGLPCNTAIRAIAVLISIPPATTNKGTQNGTRRHLFRAFARPASS